MVEKKKYPIQQIINWYYGNYCLRKCFDDDQKLQDHHKKLQLFVQKNENLKITHKDFLDLFNDHMTICDLEDSFKRKMISWKLMELLRDIPEYDHKKITVEGRKVLLDDKPLPSKKHNCIVCKKFGIQ